MKKDKKEELLIAAIIGYVDAANNVVKKLNDIHSNILLYRLTSAVENTQELNVFKFSMSKARDNFVNVFKANFGDLTQDNVKSLRQHSVQLDVYFSKLKHAKLKLKETSEKVDKVSREAKAFLEKNLNIEAPRDPKKKSVYNKRNI